MGQCSWLCVCVCGAGGGAPLPVDRQVQPVQGVGDVWRLAGLQLQLGQQGEVVRGDVRVRAARDAVVHQPLAVQRPQQAQDAQVGLGEEDVVDDTLQGGRRTRRRTLLLTKSHSLRGKPFALKTTQFGETDPL